MSTLSINDRVTIRKGKHRGVCGVVFGFWSGGWIVVRPDERHGHRHLDIIIRPGDVAPEERKK